MRFVQHNFQHAKARKKWWVRVLQLIGGDVAVAEGKSYIGALLLGEKVIFVSFVDASTQNH